MAKWAIGMPSIFKGCSLAGHAPFDQDLWENGEYNRMGHQPHVREQSPARRVEGPPLADETDLGTAPSQSALAAFSGLLR